jgi:hypothetical protein
MLFPCFQYHLNFRLDFSAAFSGAWAALDPDNPAEFHAEARSWLFGHSRAAVACSIP